MRKNAHKRVVNEKHLAFSPPEKVEDEPDFLCPRRKNPIRKVPRKSKNIIIREVPRQLLTRRLGGALILYPFIHSFIRSFESTSPYVLMVYLNLKYMKVATLAHVMKVHNLRKALAAKYLRMLMDMGVVERFRVGVGSSYCFALTLKGKEQVASLEWKARKIMESIDFKKIDEWKDDDSGN